MYMALVEKYLEGGQMQQKVERAGGLKGDEHAGPVETGIEQREGRETRGGDLGGDVAISAVKDGEERSIEMILKEGIRLRMRLSMSMRMKFRVRTSGS